MSQIYIHGSRLFTSIFSICGHPENMWSSNPPTKYEQMQIRKICVKPTPITDSSRLLSLKIMGFNFHFSFQKISPNNTLEKESNFENRELKHLICMSNKSKIKLLLMDCDTKLQSR